MSMSLNENKIALALASASSILYMACAILFIIFPERAINIFKNLFHGIDLTKIAVSSIQLTNVVYGLIEIIILSLIFGWLFAKIYNKILK